MQKRSTKYPAYQDYIIRDGKFIGEFEEMYKDFDDPWEQTSREIWSSEKAVTMNFLKKISAKRVIELGCGLGCFTKKINDLGIDVMGVDVSETAIKKARLKFPDCKFTTCDILDYKVYKEFKPDVIIMAEITWYILEKLDAFIKFFKTEMQGTYLIHLLTTYPEGVQKYGLDYFKNLSQILDYFNAVYLEYGEISSAEMRGAKRTYFFGRWV